MKNYSIWKDNCNIKKYDKLDKLGFDEYFYSSILINNPSIQYRKIQNKNGRPAGDILKTCST